MSISYNRRKAFDGYMTDYPENPFGQYRNIHKDKSCIFYGSGPTILNFKKDMALGYTKVPDSFLQFGMNDQIFLDLDLDYWFQGDALPQVPHRFYNRFDDYNNFTPKIQKFVRYCNWEHPDTITVPGWGIVPRTGQSPLNMNNTKYYVGVLGRDADSCLFHEDISMQDMTTVASISFEVLQFILFTGIKEIFLVGHDSDYSKGTFDSTMIGLSQGAGTCILNYWHHVAEWLTKNRPDVKIYSVNPVSLNLFEKTDMFD